jgi:ribosomal protein S18 acetylase RimI-like enzyme
VEESVSDFYRRRRVVIKDATALLTFFLGFVWSGAFVWPFLADQVDRGDITRGLAYFLSAVLGSAIVAGAVGLGTGNFLGGLWEHYHRQHRAMEVVGGPSMPLFGQQVATSWAGSSPSSGLALTQPAAVAPLARSVRDVYYSEAGVYAASFIPLAERVRPARYQMRKMRAALARTTNIGAWDGARLVGAVRVLSDGYTFSAVADILVDPEYQRMGIGRALLQRALAGSADARLLIDAPPDCIGFFERIGCERGAAGFVLRRPAQS